MNRQIKPYDEQKALDELRKLSKDDFYPVKSPDGKIRQEPSARALQKWANERGISTAILETEVDNEHVYVKVAGWIGSKDNPTQYKEAAVNINFKVKEAQWLFQQAAKGRIKIKIEDGKPRPGDDKSAFKFYQYAFNLRDFALRVAVTKAEAIVHKKLLSLDWREDEEKEFEEQEVEAVKGEKRIETEEKTFISFINRYLKKDFEKYNEILKKFLIAVGKNSVNELSNLEQEELIKILKKEEGEDDGNKRD